MKTTFEMGPHLLLLLILSFTLTLTSCSGGGSGGGFAASGEGAVDKKDDSSGSKAKLKLKSISPEKGFYLGGEVVLIRGVGMDEKTIVSLGEAPCSKLVFKNSTEISCTTSKSPTGVVDLYVKNSDDVVADLPAAFTYYGGAPRITSLKPNFGPISGGTTIQVIGKNLASSTIVTIGGKTCKDVKQLSPEALSCTLPARPTVGDVDVTVKNEDSESFTLPLSFYFRYKDEKTSRMLISGGYSTFTWETESYVVVRGSDFIGPNLSSERNAVKDVFFPSFRDSL